jgi:hypothetical protein
VNEAALEAEVRLAMREADGIHRRAAIIMQEMTLRGTANGGAAIEALVDALKEQGEKTAERLIGAYLMAGERNPEKIAAGVRSRLEPFMMNFLSSSVPRGPHQRSEVDVFLNSIVDRATVAVARVPHSTERPLAQIVPARLPTGWERVDRALEKARDQLARAKTEEEFQTVGLLCREVLISAGQLLYDPARYKSPDGVEPSDTDAKQILGAYFATELVGSPNEELRRHARAALDVASALVHKRTADFRFAALCLEATSSVVNIVTIVAGTRDAG